MTKIIIKKYIDDSSNDESNMEPTKEAWIDGYEIGDRLLEGLPICIRPINDGTDIQVIADWWPEVNKEYFINKIKEWAFNGDICEMYSTKEMINDDCLMIVVD